MIKKANVRVAVLMILLAAPAIVFAQDRGSAEVALNQGIERFELRDYDAARERFERALAFDPDLTAARYFLGLTLLQLAAEAGSEQEKRALRQLARARFDQSRRDDPELLLAFLDGGIADTLLDRFDDAESELRHFIEQRPDDPLPHLFLAVMHYRLAKEDPDHLPRAFESLKQAEDILARPGRDDPALGSHIYFYRALLELRQDDHERAREALRKAREIAPETDLARQSEELLDRIERGEIATRRPWDLTLRMGLDYDTNVILRGRGVPRDRENADDLRFAVASDFTLRLYHTDEWVAGAGVTTYNSWHGDNDPFNIQAYGANVYAAYSPSTMQWMTAGLRFDWDFTLLGNQSFLDRYRLTPQLYVREADWTDTTLFYQLEIRDYRTGLPDRSLDRDGDTHAFGVNQRFELCKMFERPLTANISYRFENVSTDGTEFASKNNIFAFGLDVPLPLELTFDFRSEWEVGHYKNRSLFDFNSSRRRDVIHNLIFGLTKRFDENLSVRFQVDVTDADSNIRDDRGQEPFSYNRVIYGLTLVYRF